MPPGNTNKEAAGVSARKVGAPWEHKQRSGRSKREEGWCPLGTQINICVVVGEEIKLMQNVRRKDFIWKRMSEVVFMYHIFCLVEKHFAAKQVLFERVLVFVISICVDIRDSLNTYGNSVFIPTVTNMNTLKPAVRGLL